MTLPWIMHNDAGAVTVAVGGTQQIHAVALTLDGTPAANVPAATFTSSDPSTATVTSDGLVTGVAVTQTPTLVFSSVVINGVTFADTTQVAVTATAHPLKSFSIHPAPGDSAKFGLGGSATINLVAIDLTNTQQYDLAVKYTSSDPFVGQVYYGYLYAQARGTTNIIASATAYGTAWADTVLYTVTNPMTAYMYCYGHVGISFGLAPFNPNMAVVGVGGTVTWYNYSQLARVLTFDDPTAVPGGVLNFPTNGSSQHYTFTKAGIYTFKDDLGDPGTVAVVAN
jgi:plastocyanin